MSTLSVLTGLCPDAAHADDAPALSPTVLALGNGAQVAEGRSYVDKRRLQTDIDSKDFAGVVSETTALIAMDPSEAVNYFLRGTAYVALRKFDRAIPDLMKFTAMKPDDAQGFYNLGSAYAGNLDNANAASTFEKAFTLKSNMYYAASAGAAAYKKVADGDPSDLTKASAAYDKAIALYDKASRISTVSSMQRADALYNEAAALEAKAKALDDIEPLKTAVIVWGKWERLSPYDPELPKIETHVSELLDKIDREE